jgi:hypothetical protein
MSSESGARNVVLVHGGFVDGSGWQAVHDLLTKDGYRVGKQQFLAGDAGPGISLRFIPALSHCSPAGLAAMARGCPYYDSC